jgi:predicted nucleic acid-binding protein
VTVLLDTSVLIDVLRNRGEVAAEVAGMVREHGHTLAISVMTVGEVYAGMRGGEETKTEGLLSSLECYAITEGIARRAGEMRNSWRRLGRTLELADLMIAATVLEHGLALMTDNRKDFPMPELRFYPVR